MRDVPGLSAEILVYLNRLSDLLFVLARLVNAEGRAAGNDLAAAE